MSVSEGKKDIFIAFLFFFLSLLVFTRGLSIHGLESRDDEIFYFKSTQEMLTSGNFLSPTYFGENRFQKPILFYWLILFSYKIFGVNWFAARFVSVFFGGLSIALTWLIARQFFDRKLSALSVGLLMTVPLFFRHAKNAVPDMSFNFFILLSIWCILKFISTAFPAHKKYGILFFIACGLGFMIKGPAAVLIPILVFGVYVFLSRRYNLLREINFLRGLGILLLIILPWFLYMIKIHGLSYLEYMWVNETKYRIVGDVEINPFEQFQRLSTHPLFYLKVILSYFAPWSLFFFLAVVLFFIRLKMEGKALLGRIHRSGVSFFVIWTAVVFLFFSFMYFVINHYLLIMATPFAILVSYFLLSKGRETVFERMVYFSRKYVLLGIMTFGWLVCAFYFIFLLGLPKSWVIIFFALYAASMTVVYKINQNVAAPFILSFLMLSMMGPSSLFLERTGLSAHATFKKLTKIIEKGLDRQTVIAVGSHDIHEKEVQVFFDRPVKKSGSDYDPLTRSELNSLFSWPGKIYCFILEKDYEKFVKDAYDHVVILQQEYILRKRVALDPHFFMAILKLDQKTARDYLVEKILLIERPADGGH